MKHKVLFEEGAERDLEFIYDLIAAAAGERVAGSFAGHWPIFHGEGGCEKILAPVSVC